MNIVMITTGKRKVLLNQSLTSLFKNADHPSQHHLTIVHDGYGDEDSPMWRATEIFNSPSVGASASRNIGASSIPKYRRQEYVCFLDDDVYMCPRWDERIEEVFGALSPRAVSGHAHPFNHTHYGTYNLLKTSVITTNVISTVNIACSWKMWDDVGFFAEPGGPGGSEDVDWCKRATEKGYGLAVTDPQCVIHTGLVSSRGEPIVGHDLVVQRNKELMERYDLAGKVVFS